MVVTGIDPRPASRLASDAKGDTQGAAGAPIGKAPRPANTRDTSADDTFVLEHRNHRGNRQPLGPSPTPSTHEGPSPESLDVSGSTTGLPRVSASATPRELFNPPPNRMTPPPLPALTCPPGFWTTKVSHDINKKRARREEAEDMKDDHHHPKQMAANVEERPNGDKQVVKVQDNHEKEPTADIEAHLNKGKGVAKDLNKEPAADVEAHLKRNDEVAKNQAKDGMETATNTESSRKDNEDVLKVQPNLREKLRARAEPSRDLLQGEDREKSLKRLELVIKAAERRKRYEAAFKGQAVLRMRREWLNLNRMRMHAQLIPEPPNPEELKVCRKPTATHNQRQSKTNMKQGKWDPVFRNPNQFGGELFVDVGRTLGMSPYQMQTILATKDKDVLKGFDAYVIAWSMGTLDKEQWKEEFFHTFWSHYKEHFKKAKPDRHTLMVKKWKMKGRRAYHLEKEAYLMRLLEEATRKRDEMSIADSFSLGEERDDEDDDEGDDEHDDEGDDEGDDLKDCF